MNIQMILIGLGGLAIFVWSKLSPKEPTEKTEILETPLPESGDIFDTLKTGAAKIAGIVGGGLGIAKVVPTILPAARVLPKAVTAMLPKVATTLAVATKIPLTALPAARILPKAVIDMVPKPVSAVAPKTATSLGATLGGAAMVVSPLIVVPFIAKTLDKLFGIGESGLHDDPELLARQLQITKEKEEMIAAAVPGGAVPSWDPKTGFIDDPDDPGAFPGGY